jgi:hypothetical protein
MGWNGRWEEGDIRITSLKSFLLFSSPPGEIRDKREFGNPMSFNPLRMDYYLFSCLVLLGYSAGPVVLSWPFDFVQIANSLLPIPPS